MDYFEKPGKSNTGAVVAAVLQRAEALDIKYVVVASNGGQTAEAFLEKGLQVVCVTHHVGYKGPGEDEMTAEMREYLQAKGVKILTTTHLLAGVDRALRLKFQGIFPAEIMANTLKIFGQGVKVCVEVSSMALDAGLIPYGEEIIAVGGTGRGADAACVILPAHSNDFFDTKVKEIICKPR
jgi:uncharacterized protein